MNKQHISLFIIILALLLTATTTVSFASTSADKFVAAGEIVEKDLTINEDLEIEAGGVVDADVGIFGGNATIAGTINGDLVVFGGDVDLEASALVHGDCVVIGGNFEMSPEANQECTTLAEGFAHNFDNTFAEGFGFEEGGSYAGWADENADFSEEEDFGRYENQDRQRGQSVGASFMSILLFGLLSAFVAYFIATIAPYRVNQISESITDKPVATGTVGILTFFASTSLITILSIMTVLLSIICVGLIGIPIVMGLGIVFAAAQAIGWVAVSKVVGETICDVLRLKTVSTPKQAALGAMAMSIVFGSLSFVPAVGIVSSIIYALIGGAGLGAAALTRFGTRPWPLFVVDEDKEYLIIDNIPDDAFLL